MEPLTPDQDELAERQPTQPPRRKGGSGDGGGGSGGARSLTIWLLLLLIVVGAVTAGWTFWEQRQRILSLEGSVKTLEAELRGSQLQLASVDEERAETGEEISEKLDFLDGEMRKLWAIAHQRNQPAIEENTEALSKLESRVGEVASSVDQLVERVSGHDQSVETLKAELAGLEESLGAGQRALERIDELAAETATARETLREELEGRVRRGEQDRKLAMEDIAARVDRLEREINEEGASEEVAARLSELESRLDDLDDVVESVDQTRAQLTSRFVQLNERVENLAQRIQ